MTLPATPTITVRFTNNAIFADALVLGTGVLGTNVLGDITTATITTANTIDIRRGRKAIDTQINTGIAIVTFQDSTGDWNPQNTASPYAGQLVPNQQLQISASGTNLYCGYIRSYSYNWQLGADYANVIILANDALDTFANTTIETVTGTSAGQTGGARVADILDTIGWPDAGRALDTGTVALQDDPGNRRTALQALQTVADTELGAVFVDNDGVVTFLDEPAIATAASATALDFADNGTGEEYQQVDIVLDDTQLYNDVTVQADGGTAQNAQDANSIDRYYLRSLSRTGLLMQNDADALTQAEKLVDYYAEPRLRLNSITFEVYDAAGLTNATSVDLFNSVRVRKTYSTTDTVEFASTIQGIDHSIRPDRWRTTFSTVEPISSAFILGDSDFGILGVNILT